MAIDISEFRKHIRFDDPQTPTTTRAKYLLFYVTKHSRLRPDMEPKVIKERLDDWGYRDITVEAIQDAFDHDPEVRLSSNPSRQRVGAYELTPQAEFRIKALLKDSDERIFEKTVLATVLTICLFSVVILLGIIGYGLATYNENVRDLSFPEFRKRVQFDDSTTKDTDRAKFLALLYYQSGTTQARHDCWIRRRPATRHRIL